MKIEDQIEVAVVYLMVKEYGQESIQNFARSYQKFDAGHRHDLIIVAKQFLDTEEAEKFINKGLGNHQYKLVLHDDVGLDLGTYKKIAQITSYEIYCFLNSLSEVCTGSWLDKLVSVLRSNGKSISAFSGSWQSMASDCLVYESKRIPADLLNIRRWLAYCIKLIHFRPFPNPHVRTNLFAIHRTTFLDLEIPKIRTKFDAWKLESGRNGISAQIQRSGGSLIMVDVDGREHLHHAWNMIPGFWNGDQGFLIGSDKQTRLYDEANLATKKKCHDAAWLKPKLSRIKVFGIYPEYILVMLFLSVSWSFIIVAIFRTMIP